MAGLGRVVPGGAIARLRRFESRWACAKSGASRVASLAAPERLGRFVVGLERERQVVINIRAAGKRADRVLKIGDRRLGVPERELSAAAEEPCLTVVGGHFQHAVES